MLPQIFLFFRALYASFVGVLVIMSFVTLDTFVAFAMYANCDLVKSGRIKKYDEVSNLFICVQ